MTLEKARAFLDQTEWYEMVELALGQPMPEWVREQRERAKAILGEEGESWKKTSSKQ